MTAEEENSEAIDPTRLRRFAIGVALVMFVYVAAGGYQIEDHLTIESLKIKLSRPRLLLWLLPIVSFYASLRYWWYAIKAPVTRNKIRHYLRHTQTLLIIKTWETAFRAQIEQQGGRSVYQIPIMQLDTMVPAGMSPYSFIIFTDANKTPDHNYMCHLCRNRIDTYFPGIGAAEFHVDDNQDHHAWLSPSRLTVFTRARAFAENSDLWLPIILNSIAVVLFLFYMLCVR